MPQGFESFHQPSADTVEVAQANIPVPDELSPPIGRIRPSLAGIGRIESKQPAQVNNTLAEVSSNGTGFVIDKNSQGCLLFTKEHVVHDLRYGAMRDDAGTVAKPAPGSKGPEVIVNLPDLGPRSAQVLLADESTDSAILQIESKDPERECKVVPLARSSTEARANDLAVIVGFDGVTSELNGLTGIVGGTTNISVVEQAGARVANPYVVPRFVNSQPLIAIYGAAAPRGYSGGPTFNRDGEVIGASHAQVGTGTLVTPVEIVKAELARIQKK